MRYIYLASTRGPFRLSIQSTGGEVAGKVFDLATHPDGVDWDYVWDSFDVDLAAGEIELVFFKGIKFID